MKTKELRDKIADLILAEATPEEFVALFQSKLRAVLERLKRGARLIGHPTHTAGLCDVAVPVSEIDKELKKLDD